MIEFNYCLPKIPESYIQQWFSDHLAGFYIHLGAMPRRVLGMRSASQALRDRDYRLDCVKRD